MTNLDAQVCSRSCADKIPMVIGKGASRYNLHTRDIHVTLSDSPFTYSRGSIPHDFSDVCYLSGTAVKTTSYNKSGTTEGARPSS